MNHETILAELAKFNTVQRHALRAEFGQQSITYLKYDVETDHVTVQFSDIVQYTFYIGPRGGIRHITIRPVPHL
jgi:hypothetical protein